MKVILRQQRHAELLREYSLKNAVRLKQWEPTRAPEYHSLASWELRLREERIEYKKGKNANFIGLSDDESEIIGTCSLSNIIHFPVHYCNMGYSVDGDYEGKGQMTMIVNKAVEFAFEELKLNRIMAAHMPSNIRSSKLLAKLGFQREGLAKRYLLIDGHWQDHVLNSLLNPNTVNE